MKKGDSVKALILAVTVICLFVMQYSYTTFKISEEQYTSENTIALEDSSLEKNLVVENEAIDFDYEIMELVIAEGVSQEEIDKAVQAGIIKLYDGMITDEPMKWEERDGEFWCEFSFGEEGMSRCSDDDGNIMIMTTKYVKEN